MEDKEPLGFRERVKDAIKQGGGPSAMASKTGIPVGTINKYVAMSSAASLSNVVRICRTIGLTIDELISGQSVNLQHGADDASGQMHSQTLGVEVADFIALPFLDIHASAGYGAVAPIHEEVRTVISFERAFLRSLGAMPDGCKIIAARGDSMVPTIPDGALIVVDHSQCDVVNGWISVVNVGGDLLVKRIRRRLDGTVELVSDNPIYPVETIGSDRIDQLTIIGRVVYFCRAP
ncbi:LexA family transcriptional regulator [Agrobacterium sp. rho-13.3]|uniref:LexA family transcriptional regulator n=1 Tax=Agrobacterium sp. rho-13.3 TaxID=3072980 RepID=UPI002A12A093|nr:LexA family transcriptional regulator [Agrobacterium sp. rho-13.3]MDX8310054.1 LexA family transcriptional regulator [Agrobacterium sp. rho-13.3]